MKTVRIIEHPITRRWLIAILTAALLLLLPLTTFSQEPRPDRYKTFLFGVDYYPEHWEESDYYKFARSLDIHSYSNYPTFDSNPQYSTGARMTMLRGFNGRFMIMEQLTGPAGQTYLLRTPHPGEMNLWAWQTIAHGSEGVVHFRWRSARRGVEEYWYGVLDHDDVPRARYQEFKKEGLEIRKIGQELLGSKVVSDIGSDSRLRG